MYNSTLNVLNCVVVDDDLMARKTIERLCNKNDRLRLLASYENGEDALVALNKNAEVDKENEIHLVFLDMEMPNLSGIEMLDRLTVSPLVIFTTSKTEYAFEAFEYQAVDYLKKPVLQARFDQAVEKALRTKQEVQAYQAESNEIYVRTEGKFIRVSCDDILFFENVGDYVRVKTINNSYIIHGTLKGIDEKLNNSRFLKVHRSFIVNMQKIVDIEENTLVIDKSVIPISRAHKPILMSRLKIL
jgi:DNA-binding LytR/AlgR family response regulator